MSSVAPSPPKQGQLVNVGQRPYVVTDVANSTVPANPLRPSDNAAQHLVSLSSVEDDAIREELQVISVLEAGAQVIEKVAPPEPTGFGPPRLCVQVKSSPSPADVNVLRGLQGILQNFHAEQGLLVCWGGCKQGERIT